MLRNRKQRTTLHTDYLQYGFTIMTSCHAVGPQGHETSLLAEQVELQVAALQVAALQAAALMRLPFASTYVRHPSLQSPPGHQDFNLQFLHFFFSNKTRTYHYKLILISDNTEQVICQILALLRAAY